MANSSFMVVRGTRGKPVPLQLSLENTPLPRRKTLRYLGFTLDESLTYSDHWSNAATKARCQLGSLWHQLKGYNTPGLFAHVYTTFILPALTYGLVACAPLQASSWRKVECCHSLAARMSLRIYSKRTSATAMYSFLGWKAIRITALFRCMYFILRCTISGRRFGKFLTCSIYPSYTSMLRNWQFKHGEYHIARSRIPSAPTVPLSRMLDAWNRLLCLPVQPQTRSEIESNMPLISSRIQL